MKDPKEGETNENQEYKDNFLGGHNSYTTFRVVCPFFHALHAFPASNKKKQEKGKNLVTHPSKDKYPKRS